MLQEEIDIEFNKKVSEMIAGFISNEQSESNQISSTGMIDKNDRYK